MRIENVGDHEYLVADSKADFAGWQVLWAEDWKPGVKRMHIRTPYPSNLVKFRLVYCADEHVPTEYVTVTHSRGSVYWRPPRAGCSGVGK